MRFRCVWKNSNNKLICSKDAVFNVWYASCGGLYNHLCLDHLVEALQKYEGTEDEIVQVSRIEQ